MEAISGYPLEAMISNSLNTFIRELSSSIRSQQVKSNPDEFLLQYEDWKMELNLLRIELLT